MPERAVRFTEEFFERLDSLLPEDRGDDGTPSVTDFLAFELPAIRDRLASDHEAAPSPPSIRMSGPSWAVVSSWKRLRSTQRLSPRASSPLNLVFSVLLEFSVLLIE